MKMNFREFIAHVPDTKISDFEVANYYLHHRNIPVREIASASGRSIGELYRILHKFGHPNRSQSNKHTVIALADSNLSSNQIANLTGYTSRHVRNILSQLKD